MTAQPLSIVGSGMMTAVGLNAPSSCAAIRCGLNNFQETRFMDSTGEWIVASEVPLETPWRGPEKLGRMLASVINESFETDPGLTPEETPIIFCFAERERPGRLDDLNQRVIDACNRNIEFTVDSRSITVSQGRVAGVVALREARRLLYAEGAPAVVIAAVDTYLYADTLRELESRRRLLTPENSDGFVPGEGASAVIVRIPRPSEERQLVAIGIGFGVEKATIDSEEPLRADGLVSAIKGALSEAGIDLGAVDYRIVDVSGEQYSFREASLAITRVLRTLKDEFDIWHAADCVGETGAVAGPIALNFAWHASDNDYSKGDIVLCHFGNDDGKRAAVILTYQPVRGRGQ